MDYHRYGSLGVGSVPQLIPGGHPVSASGLPDHAGVTVSGVPPPLPGGSSSLLQHHHHPSLMFHYGVGGKPPSLPPPHLLASPTGTVHNNCASLSSTISTVGSHNSSAYVGSKGIVGGFERPATTVPGLGSSLSPLTTTAGSARSTSPNSSSFAAALRTLAKQATGPLVNEIDGSYVDSNLRCSPKTVNSYAGTNGPGVCVPPAVSMAHSQAHQILPDVHKEPSVLEMERLSASEELLRGFQPYRADLPTVSSVQAQLRPTLPLDLGHSYPYSSLYPHPLTHQYRLEEQLYLERYGLMRPPLPPYGIGGLSSLYPSSPFMSTRFPPEMIPNSLSVLHPSSALLHERLKLEEDIRQREYEFEMRRERELERERGREREREREKDRRHKDQHDSDRREERQKTSDSLRDRSPLSHSSSAANSITSLSNSSSLKKATTSSSQQQSRSSDRPKHDQVISKSQEFNQRLDPGRHASVKQRPPTIVRPFENAPTSSNPVLSSAAAEDKDCKVIKDTHRELPVVSSASHKTVWQPVQLSERNESVPTTEATVHPSSSKSGSVNGDTVGSSSIKTAATPPVSYPNIGSLLSQPTSLRSTPVPAQPVPPKSEDLNCSQPSVIMTAGDIKPITEDSKLSVNIKTTDVPSPFLAKPTDVSCPSSEADQAMWVEVSSPDEPPPSPVSRLDLEELKMRTLRESGVESEEAEDILFEEMLSCPSGFICTKGPPVPLDDSEEKLSFLSTFDLTTHETAGNVQLENLERRVKAIGTLVIPMDEKGENSEKCSSAEGLLPFVAPGLNLSEMPRLKGANSLLSDFPNKSRFLQNLGMHPQRAKPKQNEIDSMWLHVLEERIRRYGKCADELSTKLLPPVRKLLKTHKDRDNISMQIKTPPASPTRIHENGPCSQLSENVIDMFGQHIKTLGITSAKVQAALMDAGMKGLLTDGLYGINNILENDPILSNMSGIDKMIERLVKNAEADNDGKGNSLLLKHIEEVRRSQVSVCQTAQLAQEQVTKLIKTRTQLESHRASLHHHLSAISSLLAQTGGPASETFTTAPPISTSSSSFNTPSPARQTNGEGGNQSGPSVGSSVVRVSSVVGSNALSTTASTWPPVFSPFLPGNTSKEGIFSPVGGAANDAFLSTKDQKMLPLKSSTKPITTHSSSTSKANRTPVTKSINKIISSSCVNPGKFNGATNSILSPLSLLASTSNSLQASKPSPAVKAIPTSTFPPSVAIGAVLGMSPTSQLFYVTTTAGSNNVPQRSASQSISKGTKTPTKPPLNFTPYSKNSPSKVQNWLPNN